MDSAILNGMNNYLFHLQVIENIQIRDIYFLNNLDLNLLLSRNFFTINKKTTILKNDFMVFNNITALETVNHNGNSIFDIIASDLNIKNSVFINNTC